MKKSLGWDTRFATMHRVFLLLIAASITCHAQKQTNKWYFGSGAALDFNSGAPVSIYPAQCNTSEGSASISDTAGNLLFYTDGITVWNKNHQQMVNGFGLTGDFSSSQSALIVPLPGSDSLYYVFTVPLLSVSPGLSYSIIDMSLQGGLGELIIKNILVLSLCSEKVTAVFKPNMLDYWIITHGIGNSFFCYELTSAGLNSTPVTSNVGSSVTGIENSIGYLKASPTGNKLAQAIWGDNYFELFDLDNSSGVISNALILPSLAGASSGAYGVEFSNDGSLLYGSVITPGHVYQWDMNAGSNADIVASKTFVGMSAVAFNGALQMATDGKIYMAEYGSSWLGVINDPDSVGLDCNFIDQGFFLTGGINGLGLPNNFPGFFSGLPSGPSSAIAVSDSQVCEKFCLNFFDSSTSNPTSWQWSFPGGSPASSTSQNPASICYSSPGIFDVTLITSNTDGTDTLTMPDFITVYPTPPFPAITQDGLTLISTPATTYQWQLNSVDIAGATNQTYTISQSGFYTVVISDLHGCKSATSADIIIAGTENLSGGNHIAVYPNPGDGHFEIAFTGTNTWDPLLVKVYNSLGQAVFSNAVEKQNDHFTISLDISRLSAAVYYLEISTQEFTLKKKIIKTR
ncbi:MAG TPA: T9SS type A sorting domain-containing protein [Chitinophagales bacterium]|nr:T9SS type A sorting domain-containing protein [Chitinophagales bacterium]